jgi:hypothetical protein
MAADASRREALQSNSLGRALGAAIGGGVTGLLDKSADERTIDRPAQIARAQAQVQVEGALDRERAASEESAARRRNLDADTTYKLARPGIEEKKADASAQKAEQSRIFRALSTLKGQALDPSNPRIAKLLSEADAAGIPVDLDSFNNSKGNFVRYARTDPDHPERTQTVERNVATGEESVLGQKGYQQPVGADGMTASQRGNLTLGGQRFGETERHNQVTEGQGQQRINQSREFGIARIEQGDVRLGQSADRATRARYNALSSLVQRRNTLQAQANKWRSYKADDGSVQPWAEKKASVYEDQIRATEDRMQSQYGDLLDEAAQNDDGMINGPQKAMENKGLMRTPHTPAHSAPAQSSPSQLPRVSRARFRAKYPQFNGRPDSDVDAAISSSGGQPIP